MFNETSNTQIDNCIRMYEAGNLRTNRISFEGILKVENYWLIGIISADFYRNSTSLGCSGMETVVM